jgi:hypothetical protein
MAAARSSWFVGGIMTLDELLPLVGNSGPRLSDMRRRAGGGRRAALCAIGYEGDAYDAERRANL